jgi:predicted flap endonuclease-1-like 5' DNA nuclease
MSIHAVVQRSIKTRKGKGFSKAELEDAQLGFNEALKHGIPIDSRRSTKHEENVNTLKTYIEKTEPEAPAKEEKVKTAMPKIEEIEGIGPTYGKKLVDIGIKTTNDLLEAGSTEKKRKELAEKIGISHTLILGWVNRADLFRVKGVGTQYSDLLEAAGVDTVVELSKRVPEHLHEKVEQVNQEKKLVRRTPTLNEIKDWIEQAKKLPRKIEY